MTHYYLGYYGITWSLNNLLYRSENSPLGRSYIYLNLDYKMILNWFDSDQIQDHSAD